MSVAKVELTQRADVCGEDSPSKFKKYWSLTSTAGLSLHLRTHSLVCNGLRIQDLKIPQTTVIFSSSLLPSPTFYLLACNLLVLTKSIFLTSLFVNLLFSTLTCRYKSSQKEVNWSKLKKPVYLSNRGSKFSDWSATWAGYLISKVNPSLFEVFPQLYLVFQARS